MADRQHIGNRPGVENVDKAVHEGSGPCVIEDRLLNGDGGHDTILCSCRGRERNHCSRVAVPSSGGMDKNGPFVPSTREAFHSGPGGGPH